MHVHVSVHMQNSGTQCWGRYCHGNNSSLPEVVLPKPFLASSEHCNTVCKCTHVSVKHKTRNSQHIKHEDHMKTT